MTKAAKDIINDAPVIKLPVTLGKNTNDLMLELKHLHGLLCDIDQDDQLARPSLLPLAMDLVKDNFLKHKDKAVRLVTACLIANILRIFAPEAPYSSTQISLIFQLFIQQLKLVGDTKDAYYGMAYFLVESLATVKSILLVYEIEEAKERDRLVQSIIQSAIDTSASANEATRMHLIELVSALLFEADSISTTIVGCLVAKANDDTWPSQCATVRAIFQVAAERLQIPLAIWFSEQTSQLSEAQYDDGQRKLHGLLLRVANASPTAMGGIMNQILEPELCVETTELRILAVQTLGSLFQTNPIMITQYSSAWNTWLSRRNDKLSSIRSIWIKYAVKFLEKKPCPVIESIVVEKLQDPDERIREKLLDTLRTISVSSLTIEIVKEVGNRCRDRKEEVRLAALALLTDLVNSKSFPHLVPSLLFSLLYTEDKNTRILYEYYIDHSVLWPQISNLESCLTVESIGQAQARKLGWIYENLDASAKKAWRAWLKSKAQFIKLTQAYVRLAKNGDTNKLITLLPFLTDRFREPLLAQKVLSELPLLLSKVAWGQTAWNLWELLLNPQTSTIVGLETISQLEKLGWASCGIEGFLINFLLRRSAWIVLNEQVAIQLANLEAESAVCQELLSEIVVEFPSLGNFQAVLLERAIADSSDQSLLAALNTYKRYVAGIRNDPKHEGIQLGEALKQRLVRIVHEQGRPFVKVGMSILSEFSITELPELVQELANLTADPDRTTQLRGWQGLASIALVKPALLVPFIEELVVEYEYLLSETSKDRLADHDAKIDDLPLLEQTKIVATRFVKAAIPAVRELCHEDAIRWAQQLASCIGKLFHENTLLLSAKLFRAAYKALVLLDPVPSTLAIWNHFGDIRQTLEKPLHFILKHLAHRKISLLYAALPSFWYSLKHHLHQESIITLWKATIKVWCATAPAVDSDGRRIISASTLFSVEDTLPFFLLFLTLGLEPRVEASMVDSLTEPISFFVDSLATEQNITYLLDLALQVKRYSIASSTYGKQRSYLLYLLSERTYLLLRNKATSSKWAQVSSPISVALVDDLLVPLESIEKQTKNLQKNYTERLHNRQRSSDEQSIETISEQSLARLSPTREENKDKMATQPIPARRRNPTRTAKTHHADYKCEDADDMENNSLPLNKRR